MGTKKRFQNHYASGFMPWIHKNPDFNLVDMVREWPIKPGKVLEVGCGNGTDALWLAKNGFATTAVDAVEIPIQMAKERATDAGLEVRFMVKDFLSEPIPGSPFDFIFDRGYFHSYRTAGKRRRVARKMAASLKPEGMWLSLIGSSDAPPRNEGPPMRSAADIVNAVETYFQIKLIKTSKFGSDSEKPANIWVCLFQKRS